jgi:hypothetical protein
MVGNNSFWDIPVFNLAEYFLKAVTGVPVESGIKTARLVEWCRDIGDKEP